MFGKAVFNKSMLNRTAIKLESIKMKRISSLQRFSTVLLVGLTMLWGCGGGGGGGSSPPPVGALSVTVSDEHGVKVAGATVQAIVGTTSESRTTNDQGVAALPLAAGSASVTVSRATFLPQTISVLIENGKFTEQPVTLLRATSAAGGSLTSRGDSPVVSNGGQSMTFEIELVIVDVVDGEPTPITGLTADKFSLLACLAGNVSVACVRGASSATYTAATVEILSPVTPVGVPVPYAAALMLDQSGSIYDSDPTGARLYSAKSFLGQLGNDDWVLLSAFADGDAKILSKPLTVYPSFRNSATVSNSLSYFSTLDSLATLVGGNTPLYSALDSLVTQVASDTDLPTGIAKSVVIFTDGDDTYCGDPDACRTRRQASITAANTAGVRIFTIGLSSSVNFEALGELANQTEGAFLYAENVEQLIPLYGSVGKLLSLSLPTYRLKFSVNADSAAFQPGNALFGRVEVMVPSGTSSSFVVPFIVGIPST